MLELRLFGGLSLHHAETGEQIGAPRRKPLALLALLAVREVERDEARAASRSITQGNSTQATAVPRGWLSALLWPELDEVRARRSLAQALYALRRETRCEDLVLGVDALCLNPHRVQSDLRRFIAGISRDTRESLCDAVNAYTGPFLDGVCFPDGVEFEQWTEKSRARLARAHLTALRRLAEGDVRAGRPEEAAGWLEMAQAAHPTDADLTLGLARQLTHLGRRAEAMLVLRGHCAAVRTELGVEPSAAIEELIAALTMAEAIPHRGASVPVAGGVPDHAGSGQESPPGAAPASSHPTRSAATVSFLQHRSRGRVAVSLYLLLGLAVATGGVIGLRLRLDPRPPDTIREAYERARVTSIREHSPGRVVVLSPVNVTGNRRLDSLSSRIADAIAERLRAQRHSVVSRAQVVALEQRTVADPVGRGGPHVALPVLQAAGDVQLAVSTVYYVSDDSLRVQANLLRRVPFSPPPVRAMQRVPAAHRAALEGVREVTEQVELSTISVPLTAMDSAPHRSARSIGLVLSTMRSCDVRHHADPRVPPWCWRSGNVALVPGARELQFETLRQRAWRSAAVARGELPGEPLAPFPVPMLPH